MQGLEPSWIARPIHPPHMDSSIHTIPGQRGPMKGSAICGSKCTAEPLLHSSTSGSDFGIRFGGDLIKPLGMWRPTDRLCSTLLTTFAVPWYGAIL